MSENVVFSPGEVAELIRLLEKVAANGFRWPTEDSMRAAHGVVSCWAPEIAVCRNNDGEQEVLLALYDGGVEEFRGMWHIPGGYARWDEPNIQATCNRVARREIGVDVTFVFIADAYKWRGGEHPYGRPLSLYCVCELRAPVKESGKLRFFPRAALPEQLVGPHRRFLENPPQELFRWMRTLT